MRTKTLSFILAATLTVFCALGAIGLVAAVVYETVLIQVADDTGAMVDVEFPLNPKKIVCLNYDSIDILDKLGMGDRIVGMIKDASAPKYLRKYVEDISIVDLGTMKEPNLQAIAELKPHVILSSARTAKLYKELSLIAPNMIVAVDATDGFFKGVRQLATKHGILLDKEKDIQKYLVNIEQRMERIRQKAQSRSAIQAIFVGDKLHILGAKAVEGGKGGGKVLISDLGFDNRGEDFDRSNTELSSYDYILEKNPEFIFVLDKNSAVNAEHAKAKDVLPKQEKLMQTAAFKEGKLVFLTPENIWYLNSGGLTAMETMLANFASLPKKKPEDENKEKAEGRSDREQSQEKGDNRERRGDNREQRGESNRQQS